jgi:putative glutamine amidotransferase
MTPESGRPGMAVRGGLLPRIGITVHVVRAAVREGHQELRYELAAQYARAIRAAGGLPLLVPTHPDSAVEPAEMTAALDGVLLSGGGDLPARFFEEHPDPSLRDTNPSRYDIEVALVRAASEVGVPIMGICRGHQTIVEALGGELLRDLRKLPGVLAHYQELPPAEQVHLLRTEPGSRLARAVGRQAQVNSFHRQAVSRPPAGWVVTGWSDDGLIEAVEAQAGFGLGCQFHPEWLGASEPGFDRLFEEFVAAARDRAGKTPGART